MFPVYQKIIPKKSENKIKGSTPAFDFKKGEFVLIDGRTQMVEGKEALKIWIEKCLRTTLNKYLIYIKEEKYGIPDFEIERRTYPRDLLYAEIEREVTETLLKNEEITSVNNFIFKQEHRNLHVNFEIESIYGAERSEIDWTL